MLTRMLSRISLLSIILTSGAVAGGRYLIRVPSGNIGSVVARHGLTVDRTLQGSGKDLFVVRFPEGRDARALFFDASVQNAEEDGRLLLPELAAALSPRASAQLNLAKPAPLAFYGTQALGSYINQPATDVVWLDGARRLATGRGIVAVLDTGVDVKHPVLRDSLVQGYDFTRGVFGGSEMDDLDQSTSTILDGMQSTSTILDKSKTLVLNQSTTAILDQSTSTILDQARESLPPAFGHGTMVAGLVHLIAPTAKIMPVKVFNGDGSTTMSQIVDGIYWAVDHGANVINMSFSSTAASKELKKAIDYAGSKGVICVASAGNDGKNITVYPAGYGVVGVGSTNNWLVRSSFSNFGSSVTVGAPGEGVITLFPANNYAAAWGTSFSAPLVAGGAALLVQLADKTNQSQAARALSAAWPLPGQQLGAGEVNMSWACIYRLTHRN